MLVCFVSQPNEQAIFKKKFIKSLHQAGQPQIDEY